MVKWYLQNCSRTGKQVVYSISFKSTFQFLILKRETAKNKEEYFYFFAIFREIVAYFFYEIIKIFCFLSQNSFSRKKNINFTKKFAKVYVCLKPIFKGKHQFVGKAVLVLLLSQKIKIKKNSCFYKKKYYYFVEHSS